MGHLVNKHECVKTLFKKKTGGTDSQHLHFTPVSSSKAWIVCNNPSISCLNLEFSFRLLKQYQNFSYFKTNDLLFVYRINIYTIFINNYKYFFLAEPKKGYNSEVEDKTRKYCQGITTQFPQTTLPYGNWNYHKNEHIIFSYRFSRE